MQTTLLGLAIAVILALVAALVGPFFVEWGQYRTEFEAAASRLTGLQVRVSGPMDARILPTPTLILNGIEFGRPGEGGKVRARALRVEFALGALVRGEWRAADVRLQGAEFEFGLDGAGRLDWPAPTIAIDADTVSIQQLRIEDSRAVLADAASGSRLVLDKLEFKGEVRSLAGPVKGEGSFIVAGQHYPYRIAASRAGEDGAVKVRLNVDPIDRPVAADAEASVWIEDGTPHFDGSLQLARAVGRAAQGAQSLLIEPWRVSSRFKGDSTAAVLEQIEFQYGPDDRATKVRGDARLTFGPRPQLEGVLSALQIDLDRVLALPEGARRRPLAGLKALADYVAGAQRLPIPVKLGVSAETVTLAGAVIQRVSGDVKIDADALDIETLDFRAPGLTQVRLSGRLSATPQGIAFVGPARIDSGDPRALAAWLTDRNDAQTVASGPLRASGEITLSRETIAVDRLAAEFERTTLEGRLAYSWAAGDRPPRLDAALSAPEIDLDRAGVLAQGVFGDGGLEWPHAGTLAVKVGRAAIAGVEAKNADINMRLDDDGLEIARFALGDFGGAALAVTGRIDTRASSPRGAVTLDLDARSFDGLAALTEKFAPQAADQLRRTAGRFAPAKLHATLAVDSDAAPATAKFKLGGSAGSFRIDMQGDASALGAAFTIANLPQIAAGKLSLAARLDAGDGNSLLELLGLDRLVAVDKRPARLTLTANGPFNADLTVDGQLVAGGLDASVNGTLRLAGKQSPAAGLALKVATANLRTPRPVAAGRSGDTLPTTLTARLTLAEGTVGLTDLLGKVADAEIKGQLEIGLTQPVSVDGQIEVETVDFPAALAAAVGVPAQGSGAGVWPAEPFDAGLLGSVRGQIAVKSTRLALTPKLAARELRGILSFGPSEIAFESIDGTLAGGRLAGSLIFQRGADGMAARGQLRVAGAEVGELFPGDGRPPLSGRLTLDLDIGGSGRSPVALVGSLEGDGTFTLQDAGVARLDPAAFDQVTRAVDQGLPIDAIRIRDRVEAGLASGGLSVPMAEGSIVIANGQLRLPNTAVRARGADLAISTGLNLTEGTMDARLTLTGPAVASAPSSGRPDLMIGLKGPIDAPKRVLDVNALASWLALRAVEQQANRLDALESGRDPSVLPPSPGSAPVPRPAPTAPGTQTRPRPTTAVPGQPLAPVGLQKPKPVEELRPRPTAPVAEQVPAPPPPMDIRPAAPRARP